MEGTLSKVSLANENDNWRAYDIAFSDGEEIRALIPRRDTRDKDWDQKLKSFDLEQYKGKTVSCYMGGKSNDTWFIAYKDMLGEKKKTYQGGKGGSGKDSYNNYWEEKYGYEVDVKDPETAVRSLFISVQQFYSAALPNMAKKPKDTIECDAMLDEAVGKATEIFVRMRDWVAKNGGLAKTDD